MATEVFMGNGAGLLVSFNASEEPRQKKWEGSVGYVGTPSLRDSSWDQRRIFRLAELCH